MNRHAVNLLVSAVLASALCAAPALATTFNVNDDASLRAALTIAVDGDVINFTGTVVISGNDLPAIQKNITVEGNGFALDGANAFRGLFVYSGTVSVSDLTIQKARAKGGGGGFGGGGGAGLGGALFVAKDAKVTVSNVQLSTNTAAAATAAAVTPAAAEEAWDRVHSDEEVAVAWVRVRSVVLGFSDSTAVPESS